MSLDLNEKLNEFFSLGEARIKADFDPWLFSYYRKLFTKPTEARGFLRWCSDLANITNSKGCDILDAGCGFGITCFGFIASEFPPGTVYGLDPSERKIEVMSKVCKFLNLDDDRIRPVVGDAMSLTFPDSTFDVVFIKDVASHVCDRPKFFREITRVLKPGGRLLLTDENNGLSLLSRSTRRKLWNQNEFGPLPPESWMARPYRDERRRMIKEWRPELPDEEVGRLAAQSQGMWGDSLRDAIISHQSGTAFQNTADFPYRHPVSGEYMEYPFNPFTLARELINYGLKGRVIPPRFAVSHPLKRAAGGLITAFHPLTIFVQPSFYILAIKKR